MTHLIVREIAEKQGLNQSQLQIRAGVTPALLNRYWRNTTDSVTLSELGKIAKALGVRPGDLIVEENGPIQEKKPMVTTYREVSTTPDEMNVDVFEREEIKQVIKAIGGTIVYDQNIRRIDGHIGRYRVTLPAGCTFTGTVGGDNPQTIILPGDRKLSLYSQRGSAEMHLEFLAGESSDTFLWDNAQRRQSKDQGEREDA